MSAKGFGELIIDDGAVKALQSKKSLLAPGIIGSNGQFEKKRLFRLYLKQGWGLLMAEAIIPAKKFRTFGFKKD